ncbi:beta-ketoacyl synthase domain-containing protein [Xylaria intraflava]|nr:beta-ketoacyl synthase domain-containing protein [Xylaria intraflava]
MVSASKPSEPIAIVGAGCRFTGLATSPSKLWDLLCQAPDLSREVPPDRFNAGGFYHKDGEYHGTTDSTKAYWLDQDIKRFDTSLFNITPNEAEAMDPQQRLLLEVVFEAMESAGFPPSRYSGKNVGVYSGCMTQDYETLSARDELTTSQYFATGNSRAIMANRISYFFNFNGPSMTIDTACSSSLVAMNLAILALRAGECTMACVTGANLMLTPEQFIVESALHMLSPSGKCHMWDSGADGYARGEGFAALFIKPLSRALADGDRIEGIIREVGTNADGKTNGITMPNPAAQAGLIRATYQRAGLDPKNPSDRCQYFEAHGTGTAAGDPREAAAIHEAFFANSNADNDVEQPSPTSDKKLLVGSIKTVIGHTEAAAGLAGVLKVVWGMKHGVVPPNLHFKTLNPQVEPYYKHLEIPTTAKAWPEPAPGQPRRASVNSFGFGGANAHAIIEAYDPEIHGAGDAVTRVGPSHPIDITGQAEQATTGSGILAQPQSDPHVGLPFPLPIIISAASLKSLRDVVQSYKAYLDKNQDINIHELAWHQFHRRAGLPYRVAICAATTTQALEELNSLLREPTIPDNRIIRNKATKSPPRILGIFTGQGAQWKAMSKSLLLQSSVYRDSIKKLDAVLKTCPNPCSWTLEEMIMDEDDGSHITKAAVSQPLCTAVQIALVDLMRSIGINFHTVVGHSSGEIAAAYAAGKISAEDAIVISYYRGMVAHLASGADGQKGGMLAAGLSESEALSLCSDPMFGGRICIAATNSPELVTISGDLDAINLAKEQLRLKDQFVRPLHVDTAYHSNHMAAPAVAYIQAMKEYGVSPIPEGNKTVWVSSVEGRPRSGAQDLDCQYWADNMVNQVQFSDAVKYALSQPGNEFDCVIEVGPHPALQTPIKQIMKALGRTPLYAYPLSRFKPNASVAEFLGFMWSNFGCANLDLQSYIANSPLSNLLDSRLDNVPPYPFDHSGTYWRESRISRQYHFKTDAPHELLGTRSRDDNGYEMKWRNILKLDKIPWLEHHSFQGQALLPASAYCIMAVDAARYFLAGRPASLVELRDIEILSGIAINRDSHGVETLFCLNILSNIKDNTTEVEANFTLYSCPADGTIKMKQHACGNLRIVLGSPSMSALPERQPSLSETLPADPSAFYEMMKTIGLNYTGPFKALNSIQRRYEYCSATVDRFHPKETTTLQSSPATLDSCFQCAFLSYASPGDGSLWAPFLPTRIGRIQFNLAVLDGNNVADPNAVLTVDTHTTHRTAPLESQATISVDISIFNNHGQTEVQVEDLTVRAIANTQPKDDLELYLYTATDVDPTDAILRIEDVTTDYDDNLLAEQCCRIATFCLEKNFDPDMRASDDTSLGVAEMWSGETQESIHRMLRYANHPDYLKLVMNMGVLDSTRLSKKLPSIVERAREVGAFQNHVGRIMKQIVHRYAWMNILCLETAQVQLSRPILAVIGDTFQSFIVGRNQALSSSFDGQDSMITSIEGVEIKDVDPADKLEDQIGPDASLDLVLLPATLLDDDTADKILDNISRIMKPGGFLIILDQFAPTFSPPWEPLPDKGDERPPTPPRWPDIQEMCGFVRQAQNSDQFHGVGYVLVRQFRPPTPFIVPPAIRNSTTTREVLLIRGLSTERGDQLVPDLEAHLSGICDHIKSRSLDEASTQELETCTAAVVLADLDEPLMSNLTQHRINQLRALMRPTLTVLWVTRGSRSQNPEHAASFGFLRTIAAEIPTLHLQMLDLDSNETDSQAMTVLFALSQLVSVERSQNTESLSAFEPEIHMQKGKRLIPRVVPWKAANDRVNAVRRIVTEPVNVLRKCVEVVPRLSDNDSLRFELRGGERNAYKLVVPPEEKLIQVDYSTALPFKLNGVTSGYVCVGREWVHGTRVAAVSSTNSSYIKCPSTQIISFDDDRRPSLMIIHQLIRYVASFAIASSRSHSGRVILIDPEVEFTKCLVAVAASKEVPCLKVTIMHTVSADEESRYAKILEGSRGHTLRFLHPRATMRDLKKLFPRDACVFNFNPEDEDFSRRISATVSSYGNYYSAFNMFSSQTVMQGNDFLAIEPLWELATAFIAKDTPTLSDRTSIVSLKDLQQQSGSVRQFQIIDWKSNRDALKTVNYLVEEDLMSPNKTYLMFGMTRDSGHSICRLLLQHGAKNVVLASRNPNTSPNWVTVLGEAYGADIRIERADVTSYDSLVALKDKISQTMPPVGGVINGAMVLEDRVFDQMTIETWNRVLHPKTIGSKNLDVVFNEPDLEFFIMTSSFAAIGGHSGQSNYAAANMFMNGLAENRQSRGLVGSAINIGVIYGLGFLQREKDHLYAGLEREGYLPISEHSLHHMFLEAIVAGRPNKKAGTSTKIKPSCITTGLRRYQRGAADPLHWHVDPRFSHFAMRNQASDDGPMTEAEKSLSEEIASLDQKDAIATVIGAALDKKLQTLLQLPEGTIDHKNSFLGMGVDSLTAVEVRNWFQKSLGTGIAVMKIMDASSIENLCMEIAEQTLADRAKTEEVAESK